MIRLEELGREAFEVKGSEYLSLIEESIDLQRTESQDTENMTIDGKLVKIDSIGETVIISDLHGDVESLLHILQASRFVERIMKIQKMMMILLGDYGDRGSHSPEVYYILMKLKKLFPRNVLLMRGNHEGPDDLLAHPHDLPQSLRDKFGGEAVNIYSRLRDLFPELYNIVIMNDVYVLIHGGIPSQARTIDDLKYAHLKHPRERHLEEMLWSDPGEGIAGVHSSPRGAGKVFGADVTERLLQMVDVRFMIRGHEPSNEGFKTNHNGKILTVFSRKGPPYSNSSGAYLHLTPSVKPRNVQQLLAHVRQF